MLFGFVCFLNRLESSCLIQESIITLWIDHYFSSSILAMTALVLCCGFQQWKEGYASVTETLNCAKSEKDNKVWDTKKQSTWRLYTLQLLWKDFCSLLVQETRHRNSHTLTQYIQCTHSWWNRQEEALDTVIWIYIHKCPFINIRSVYIT